MKVFFDTEFTGLHQETKLISIGMVDEKGRAFYAESDYFDDGYANSEDEIWIKENILPCLKFSGKNKWTPGNYILHTGYRESKLFGNRACIRDGIEKWVAKYDTVELWSDCLSYDFVLFNDLWGHAFKIPKNVYYIPFDICTMFKLLNIDPDINREEFVGMTEGAEKHNALWDAKIIKACYEKMADMMSCVKSTK